MNRISVLLVEDHLILREGLRLLLDLEADIEVIGEAGNGHQAVQLTKTLRPDVVVMDIAMPLLNGLDATRQIRTDFPETKVLILSEHSDNGHVQQAALLGAAGFLPKESSSHDLATAIREVQKGRTLYRHTQSGPTNGHQTPGPTCGKGGNRLSAREVEVLRLIAQGKRNKEIAVALGVSIKTVDQHRQHLMSKLDIHDVAGLTRYAISSGIIDRDEEETTVTPLAVPTFAPPYPISMTLTAQGRVGVSE